MKVLELRLKTIVWSSALGEFPKLRKKRKFFVIRASSHQTRPTGKKTSGQIRKSAPIIVFSVTARGPNASRTAHFQLFYNVIMNMLVEVYMTKGGIPRKVA